MERLAEPAVRGPFRTAESVGGVRGNAARWMASIWLRSCSLASQRAPPTLAEEGNLAVRADRNPVRRRNSCKAVEKRDVRVRSACSNVRSQHALPILMSTLINIIWVFRFGSASLSMMVSTERAKRSTLSSGACGGGGDRPRPSPGLQLGRLALVREQGSLR